MITYRWKQCPYCNKRYEFDSHSGATRGWEVEYFGSPTETCPNCFATISTGKVQMVSEILLKASSSDHIKSIIHFHDELIGLIREWLNVNDLYIISPTDDIERCL